MIEPASSRDSKKIEVILADAGIHSNQMHRCHDGGRQLFRLNNCLDPRIREDDDVFAVTAAFTFYLQRTAIMKFLFRVRIQPGHTVEEYAAAWVRASEIIQRAPGAQGTRLHRCIGKPNELIAIASWDSKAHRDQAPKNSEVDAILAEAARYVEIEVIGEIEEPEWVVLPPERPAGG